MQSNTETNRETVTSILLISSSLKYQESLFGVIFWPQKLFLTNIMYKSRQDSDTYVTNYRNNVIKQRVYSNYKIQKY